MKSGQGEGCEITTERERKNPYDADAEHGQQNRKTSLHHEVTSAPFEQNRNLKHLVLNYGVGEGHGKDPQQDNRREAGDMLVFKTSFTGN